MGLKNLAILISGSGSTAQAIIQATQNGRLTKIKPVVLVASQTGISGIEKAQKFGVPVVILNSKEYPDKKVFIKKFLDILHKYNVAVISQNGWLPMTPKEIIGAFPNTIINQHPGPLDTGKADFGGRGMYGKRVTCARVIFSWLTGENFWTEATTHLVTEQFDEGALIKTKKYVYPKQKKISIRDLDKYTQDLMKTTEEIATALLPIEHDNVISTLHDYETYGFFKTYKREKPLIRKTDFRYLEVAKKFAQTLYPHG